MASLIQNVYRKSRVYDWMLQGSVPDRLRGAPPDPLPGDADIGRRILDSDFRVFGHYRHLGDLPWLNRSIDTPAEAQLHRFDFLRDLKALGTNEAAAKGRELVIRWGNAFSRWHETGWQPAVTGARIVNWLGAFHFVDDVNQPGFGLSVREQLAQQVRHLARQIDEVPKQAGAFDAAEGLILGGICLVGLEAMIDTGMTALKAAINRQILPDGGHFQRSAQVQHDVLATLVRTRDTLALAQLEIPGWLENAISQMVPVLRMLRHGDGDAALFNGVNEGLAGSLDAILKASHIRGPALLNAPQTGFQRFETPTAVLIADSGAGVVSGADQDAHAGLLSFEFSRKRQRIIVNCGADPDRSSAWHDALRATAAHSALVVDDTNAIEVLSGGGLKHSITNVDCRRSDEGGSGYVQMLHNGYRKMFGLVHSRDLYLASTGEDLRGRDNLNLSGDCVGRPAERFTIRFHLHPDVSAEALGGGDQAILKLPNKEGWRFRCSGGSVSVQDSVYVGYPGNPRRSRQIVVEGPISPLGVEVKWSLILERPKKR
ncbi:MAG: heparinase II/III family protein [Rhodospirillales bacterium]